MEKKWYKDSGSFTGRLRQSVGALSVASGLALGSAFAADQAIIAPEGGADVLVFTEAVKPSIRKKGLTASGSWKASEGMPFSKAFSVAFDKGAPAAKDVQLVVPVKAAVKKGDALLVSFWIRRPKSGGQPGPALFYLQGASPKERYEYEFSAYQQWQQHVRAFKAPGDYPVKDGKVLFDLGGTGPVVEVGDLRVINYGPDFDIAALPESKVTYEGREADAAWRKEAQERIEKIRKGDLVIEVVDADGKPVKDASVKLDMQRHAFQFGTAVDASILGATQEALPFTKGRTEPASKLSWEDVQNYRQIVRENFNVVTFESELRPHVWKLQHSGNKNWESRRKVFLDQAVPWLQANDIDIRGHYIAWGAIDFNAVEKEFVGDPEGHRAWLWEHMADVLPATAGFVTEWDTINHIVGWGKHTYEIEYGGFEIYAEIMKEARRLAPDALHTVNEGRVLPNGYKREPYKEVIRFLNDHGQAPDAVGFMGHFELASLTPPVELLRVYDEFAEIAPKLQLSELDVEAGDDEQLQADFLRDVLIASFSHPNMVGIVQWGFWERSHWKPAAALWNADWTPKPAAQVFLDLVKKQWWTNATGKTDEAGQTAFRGFLGDYQVTVEHGGEPVVTQVSLAHDSPKLQITLK